MFSIVHTDNDKNLPIIKRNSFLSFDNRQPLLKGVYLYVIMHHPLILGIFYQAATIIQSHWRGFCVRREPEVAALRTWQREWNEMNLDVRNKMTKFWHGQVRHEHL